MVEKMGVFVQWRGKQRDELGWVCMYVCVDTHIYGLLSIAWTFSKMAASLVVTWKKGEDTSVP